jgi:hypothetical protein
MKAETTLLFKWICKVYSDRYDEAKQNSLDMKSVNDVSLTKILDLLKDGNLITRRLALLSLVVYINNLPKFKLQVDTLKNFSQAIISGYVFLNLLSSRSLIGREDLDGFKPGTITGDPQESKFLFNSMPLGLYPSGNFKIYREVDLIFLLSTKQFDLIPDISTCVVWVNLGDSDCKVKQLLNLVFKQIDDREDGLAN